MIADWLRKQLLVHRGLSSGKSRRTNAADDGREFFDKDSRIQMGIMALSFLAFARIGLWEGDNFLNVIVMTVLVMGVFIILPAAYEEIWKSNQLLLLFMGCLVVNLLLNKMHFLYRPSIEHRLGVEIAPFLAPTAIGPLICSILISTGAGLLLTFLLALLGSLFISPLPDFFLTTLLTGLAASCFGRGIRRRSDLLMAGTSVGLVGLLCALLLGGLHNPSLKYLMVQGGFAIAFGLTSAFIVSAILPVLEWMFDRITDISWVELSDLNHPLLKRMTLEAPGTYHHSLMVANLAEAAAQAIGANPTQCRVSAYFHDIGKLNKPNYFVENISDRNPHDTLSPSMSALIIIAHVKDGVDMALKYRLRQPIIDVICQHHGTSMVYYFYRKALQQRQEIQEGGKILRLREDDVPEVDERSFRYPGPIPQFKESAIVSLADAIESSSRALKNPTVQKIESLVKDIIQERLEDGQLKDSHLTLKELDIIAERFRFTLKNMLHNRIEYPKDVKDKEPPKEAREEKAPKNTPAQPSKETSDLPSAAHDSG